ncbi:MAG: type II secretory pathway component GspD/PulD (secretin) [Planctomycetota bacterium]|jgi:type II secretory pathway component GspD/PulD (secretin)
MLRSLVLLLIVIPAAGCVLGGDGPSERDRRAQTMFEDLISRGRSQPAGVEDFIADEDSFRKVAEAYADQPALGARGRDSVRVDAERSGNYQSNDLHVSADLEGESAPGTGGDPEELDELDLLGDLVDASTPIAAEAEPPVNPYLEFGKNIVWYPLREGDTERLIMKPYTFPAGTGDNIFGLLKSYSIVPIYAAVLDGAVPEGLGPQPEGSVLLDLRPGFSVEAYSDPRPPQLRRAEVVELSDVLFVTATAYQLAEIEHFIDLFAADVRQIEIEAKIVEVTTREALDLGVRPRAGLPILGLPNRGGFVNTVDFAFENSVSGAETLFGLGAVFDGVEFNAILEAVASFETVSIISRPKVAVREGGRADIINVTRIPFYEVSAISASGIPNLKLSYQDIGVQMFVIPRVIGRDTVILNIDIEASQVTGTAVSFNLGGDDFSVPQLSKRNARTIVRLEPGQAVILGGLISERTVERIQKVPLLGDIPLLGSLFRSKLTSKEQSNVLFFIRPRILEGSDLNSPF